MCYTSKIYLLMKASIYCRKQRVIDKKMTNCHQLCIHILLIYYFCVFTRASTDCPQDSDKDPPADQTPTTEPLKESTHEEPGNDVQPVLHEDDPATPPCSTETCGKHVQSLEQECQALRTENLLLKEKMNRTTLNEMSLHNDDKRVNTLTGLSTYSILMTIFHIVAPVLKLKSCLTCFQQYMLTLMKLRINLSFEFFGFLFWH